MTFRDSMLAVAERLRTKTGPSGFDVRPTALTIVTRTWTGGSVGAAAPNPGTPRFVDAVVALPQTYAVRQLRTFEIATSGGRFEQGDMLVGPITPRFTSSNGATGGVSEADLKPPVKAGQQVFYQLSGAHAGDYVLRELRSTNPFGYEVVIARKATTP